MQSGSQLWKFRVRAVRGQDDRVPDLCSQDIARSHVCLRLQSNENYKAGRKAFKYYPALTGSRRCLCKRSL